MRIKRGRKRGALWVWALDGVRRIASAEGRGQLYTLFLHSREVHQTTSYTEEDRYPDLMDMAATQIPCPSRILSFGCSTGAELVALRRRFPRAYIVGAEINSRSRKIAMRRVMSDILTTVMHPRDVEGTFDLIFALAVFQREPHKISEMEVDDLSRFYRFEQFNATVEALGRRVRTNGLFCIINAQYRFEDSSIAQAFEPITESPQIGEPLFAPNGRRLERSVGYTIFHKHSGGKT